MKLKCKMCGGEFVPSTSRGKLPSYCADDCRRTAHLCNNRRSLLRKRGLSPQQIDVEMLHYKPRERAKREVPIASSLTTYSHERHVCAYKNCITILCRYNSGPYCYCHADMLNAELFNEYMAKREQEKRARMYGRFTHHVEAGEPVGDNVGRVFSFPETSQTHNSGTANVTWRQAEVAS